MFCRECGNELNEGALFCPECGTRTSYGQDRQTPAHTASAPTASPSPASSGPGAPAEQPPLAAKPAPAAAPAPAAQPVPAASPVANGAPTGAAAAFGSRPKWLVPAIIAAAAALLVVLLGVGMCSGGALFHGESKDADPTVPTGKKETWSVFVYMCGSNLESDNGYASANIDELLSVDLPDNVTFVLQTGGADEWQSHGIDPDYLSRYEVSDGELVLKDQQPRVSMGDQDTLSDFLGWAVESYPADRYALVFWDHGGGSLSGACSDELDNDSLSLPELEGGVGSAGVTFELIGFDTCLMATLETAQILAPHANFLVASEELEPACGWDWAAWPAWFAGEGQKGGRGSGLGTVICDTYLDKCGRLDVGDSATLSTVNLTRVPDVAAAFASASEELARATETPQGLQPIIVHGTDAESYGRENYIKGYIDMVDLGDLMKSVGDWLEGSDAVISAIDGAVIHSVHGELSPDATGLSVFYPLKIDRETFVKYLKLSTENGLDNVAYLQFLAARTGEYDSVDWADEGVIDLDPLTAGDAKGKIHYYAKVNDEGRYELHITSGAEWVSACELTYGMLFDDGSYTLLGTDNNMDLFIDPDTYEVTYTDRANGGWMKIGDSFVYADLVDAVADESGPLYLLYSTPVEYTTKNSRGQTVSLDINLLSEYDYKTGSYTPLCVYEDADESGMAGKSTLVPKAGDKLKFLVTRYNANGSMTQGNTGTETWSKSIEMTSDYAGDGNYLYLPYIVDLFGNRYYPDGAVLTFKGGKRTNTQIIPPMSK